uniref:RdRp n=1 Tax=viral metagenome TaxID=1070528 RepID=A0A2V0RAH8_9ZZZZ
MDDANLIGSTIEEVSLLVGKRFDSDAKQKLTTLLFRTIQGSNDVILSPMAEKYGPRILLDEWDSIFTSLGDSRIEDTLLNIELAQKEKFSPRSVAKPWFPERQKDLEGYYSSNSADYSVLDCSPSNLNLSLRPLSLASVKDFIKKSTSAGLPSMQKKGIVLDQTINNFEVLLSDANRLRIPCVIFTRTQESLKTRIVFGVPLIVVLNEMRFYQPVLKVQRNLTWRSALRGPDEVASHLTAIIDEAKRTGNLLVSIDFSKYDQSIKPELQAKVGEYYKAIFQKSFSGDIDDLIKLKSEIKVVSPTGIISGGHGEPSGSAFTNEDDSIAQHCIARHSNIPVEGFYDIQGDDGVYMINPDSYPTFVSNFNKFGLEVNEDKSTTSMEYLTYLQNLYHPYYRLKDDKIPGVYPTYRALNRICYLERFANFMDFGLQGRDYFAIRTLSILENCKYHPYFEELVKFVLSKDKYELSPSAKGIADYVKFVSETEGFSSDIINQFGDDIKGIKSWESFKLVQKLRA